MNAAGFTPSFFASRFKPFFVPFNGWHSKRSLFVISYMRRKIRSRI